MSQTIQTRNADAKITHIYTGFNIKQKNKSQVKDGR